VLLLQSVHLPRVNDSSSGGGGVMGQSLAKNHTTLSSPATPLPPMNQGDQSANTPFAYPVHLAGPTLGEGILNLGVTRCPKWIS
jgi:hypothetical protein